ERLVLEFLFLHSSPGSMSGLFFGIERPQRHDAVRRESARFSSRCLPAVRTCRFSLSIIATSRVLISWSPNPILRRRLNMKMKFAAATALASSLLILPLMQGSAQSASIPSLPSHPRDLTLIAHGHGGGGRMGGGGGGPHAMGGGGPHAMGGGGPHAMRGNGSHGMDNGPHMRGGNFAEGGGGREFRRGHGDSSDHNGRNHGRFAERGRDFDHNH